MTRASARASRFHFAAAASAAGVLAVGICARAKSLPRGKRASGDREEGGQVRQNEYQTPLTRGEEHPVWRERCLGRGLGGAAEEPSHLVA